MDNSPHHENVCEFTIWILIIVNKRKNVKSVSFGIDTLIGVSLITLKPTVISITLLIGQFLDTIKSFKGRLSFPKTI